MSSRGTAGKRATSGAARMTYKTPGNLPKTPSEATRIVFNSWNHRDRDFNAAANSQWRSTAAGYAKSDQRSALATKIANLHEHLAAMAHRQEMNSHELFTSGYPGDRARSSYVLTQHDFVEMEARVKAAESAFKTADKAMTAGKTASPDAWAAGGKDPGRFADKYNVSPAGRAHLAAVDAMLKAGNAPPMPTTTKAAGARATGGGRKTAGTAKAPAPTATPAPAPPPKASGTRSSTRAPSAASRATALYTTLRHADAAYTRAVRTGTNAERQAARAAWTTAANAVNGFLATLTPAQRKSADAAVAKLPPATKGLGPLA